MALHPNESAIWSAYEKELEDIQADFKPLSIAIPSGYEVSRIAHVVNLAENSVLKSKHTAEEMDKISTFVADLISLEGSTAMDVISQMVFEGTAGQRHLVFSFPGSGEQ